MLESKIRKDIDQAVDEAKKAPFPPDSELIRDIYCKQEPELFVRGPDLTSSKGDMGWMTSG